MMVAIGPLRVCLLVLCLGLLPATTLAQGRWTKLAPFPDAPQITTVHGVGYALE